MLTIALGLKTRDMLKHTRDGSEIRRSPGEVGRLSHYLRGVLYTVPGGLPDL